MSGIIINKEEGTITAQYFIRQATEDGFEIVVKEITRPIIMEPYHITHCNEQQ